MLKISKMLILVACPVMIVDQLLSVMMITTPMWWTVMAGPGMTTLFGIGLLLFAVKTKAFNKKS